MVYDWGDIRLRAEISLDPGYSARFVFWQVVGRSQEPLFRTPSGVLTPNHQAAEPLAAGVINKARCVDLLFGGETLHFCSVADACCISEALVRVDAIFAQNNDSAR